MLLLVNKPQVRAWASLGQNAGCRVESAGRPIGGILTNSAMTMLLMRCSESLLHCAGQTCHKATSIKAALTLGDFTTGNIASDTRWHGCYLIRLS